MAAAEAAAVSDDEDDPLLVKPVTKQEDRAELITEYSSILQTKGTIGKWTNQLQILTHKSIINFN